MKYAIVVSSKTGNTLKLAQAAAQVLCGETIVYQGAPDEAALAADRLIVGFWTDKGSCNEEIAAFLQKVNNKSVFLFGTAGFGMSQEYFERVLASAKHNFKGQVQLAGTFMCAGKMQPSVRKRYEQMEAGPRKEMLLQAFDAAQAHPDETDLERFQKVLRETAW